MPTGGIITKQRVTEEKLRLAREMRREMTPEEAILWRYLRRNQLQGLHFRRQQVIDGFIVDFYCHAGGLVVEIDGGIHRAQHEYDAERDQALSALGLHILRIPNADVRRDVAAVLQRIAAAAAQPPSAAPGEP